MMTTPKTFVLSAELATWGDSRVITVVTFCIPGNASHDIECINIFNQLLKYNAERLFLGRTSIIHQNANECWLIILYVSAL